MGVDGGLGGVYPVITNPWPWGHLLGKCFSFSIVFFQSERRKIKIFTYTVGYPDIVNWSISSRCRKSNAWPLASVTLYKVLLNFLTLVVWLSPLLAALHYQPLTWGVCMGMNLHRFFGVKIQRKVGGYISRPADSIEEQLQIVVRNRILKNVLSHWVGLERGGRNYHFDSLEAGWQDSSQALLLWWPCGEFW